jgi:biopolymer transport protein ExbB
MIQLIEKGGPVMYPLLLCSLVCLTFIIERCFFWFFDMRSANTSVVDQQLEVLRRSGREAFVDETKESKNPISQTLIRSITHGEKTLSESLNLEIDTEVDKSRRSLGVIDTCVTLSPLLGIFGTVTGIIKSFELLGASGIANPHAVSAGIAEALITTATGLAIAMPSLIFHNYFLSMSDRYTFRLEQYAKEFEILYGLVGGDSKASLASREPIEYKG